MTATGEPQNAASSSLPSPLRVVDRGGAGLRAARERVAYMSELTCPGAPDAFRFAVTTFSLVPAVLLDARVSHLHYERSARHVAAGDDPYLLVAYLRGENRMRIAGNEIAIPAGHIGVVDLACPSHSEVMPPRDGRVAHHVTLLLPRAQLAPLLAAPDAVGGQLIRGDAGYGRIVLGLLLELWRQAASLDVAQGARVTHAIAGLVAGALRPAPGREREVLRAEQAARRAGIMRYLDRRTDPAEAVDIEALCRRFGMSRASLYRMFEAEGGLVHHVRQQRLQRALDLLTSPAHGHCRIVDIAMQHGFHTESGFIRAFRRHFGITPGDARAGAPAVRQPSR
jgi:AraC-like DNA-binding protein